MVKRVKSRAFIESRLELDAFAKYFSRLGHCPISGTQWVVLEAFVDWRKDREVGLSVRTCVESPYAGAVEDNLTYLRAAMKDSLSRGEAPYASHGLYTQPGVLDDEVAEQRERGILAGYAWMASAERVAFYLDLGESSGMRRARERAESWGVEIVERRLGFAK